MQQNFLSRVSPVSCLKASRLKGQVMMVQNTHLSDVIERGGMSGNFLANRVVRLDADLLDQFLIEALHSKFAGVLNQLNRKIQRQ